MMIMMIYILFYIDLSLNIYIYINGHLWDNPAKRDLAPPQGRLRDQVMLLIASGPGASDLSQRAGRPQGPSGLGANLWILIYIMFIWNIWKYINIYMILFMTYYIILLIYGYEMIIY